VNADAQCAGVDIGERQ